MIGDSELRRLALEQYRNNPMAHAMVDALANYAGMPVSEGVIMMVLGHGAILNMLLTGEAELAKRIAEKQTEAVMTFIPPPLPPPDNVCRHYGVYSCWECSMRTPWSPI